MIFDGLRQAAIAVRDGWREGWNTAHRIGTMFRDIIYKMEEVDSNSRGITDAPADWKAHVRKNGQWAEIDEVPNDGKLYGRKNGMRAEITAVSEPSPEQPSPTSTQAPTPTLTQESDSPTPDPGLQAWYSAALIAEFYRNNCGAGYMGSLVGYAVPAGKYSSTVSQADADAKAQADVAAGGQAYANANGSCVLIPTQAAPSPTQGPTPT